MRGTCHCGKTGWDWAGLPETATACNCESCRRYAALWSYDWVGGKISLFGLEETRVFLREDREIEFHFCTTCGAIPFWRAVSPHPDGRRRAAVNLRMAEPEEVAGVPVFHGDMLEGTAPYHSRGTVADMWF
ncbi:GFA family protein [Pseudoroseicyclus sp. CXY001]|uniref:GFA family protein n=1 Tax=Pseudoroseicyclus sp. CXY001 TaxID=3242492 RepID=UPI00358DA98C